MLTFNPKAALLKPPHFRKAVLTSQDCCNARKVVSAKGCKALSPHLTSRLVQLEAQQDGIVSCDMAPSGEEIVFGSAGGYLHLWALNAEPCVSLLSRPLDQVPRLASPPAIALSESGSFALAAVYPSEQVSCLPSF